MGINIVISNNKSYYEILYSNHNVTVNYAKWQLLYNEYKNFPFTIPENDGIKENHRTDLPLAETTVGQVCAQAVEKFMPLAVARPFVEEFITEEVINRVSNRLANVT